MSNQTFISVGPYWDIIHRHRTSFYAIIVAGLALTLLLLVLIPKEYTSSILLGVWHADVQPSLIGAESETKSGQSHIESRLEALSQETVARGHLRESDCETRTLSPQRQAGARRGRRNGRGDITVTIPDAVLQSKTPSRWQRSLPPDAIAISFQYRDLAKAQAVTNDLGAIMIERVPQGTRAPQCGNNQADFE